VTVREGTRSRWITIAVLVCMVGLSADEWITGRARIHQVLAEPGGAALMTGSDSAHYLQIARGFAAGDVSCSYVAPTGGADLAHRQPLYPALLALVMKLGAGLEGLALLNVGLLIAALWAAFAVGAIEWRCPIAGLAAALALWRVPFLFENATTRLLTEPGYVLFSVLAAWGFLAYRARPRASSLLLTALVLACAYLQRINGLVLAVSALSVLFVLDLRRVRRTRSVPLCRTVGRWWVSASLLFLTATAPSWVPRTIYAHNPLYHGYLSNYLWVDTHERAHVPGPARYGWRDYVREHDVGAAVARIDYGLRRTLWEAPRVKYGDAVAAAMLAGIVLAVAARRHAVLAWFGVGLLQVLPLAWAALSNPVRRIPATALLAFGLTAVAAAADIALAYAAAFFRRRRATARSRGAGTSLRSLADKVDS
jgi:hypothetical protein